METILEKKHVAGNNIPDPMIPHFFSIQKIEKETYDTFTLQLKPTENDLEFPFAPGQFNMLYAFGTGEVPISISGDPADTKKLIHTVRSVGAVTKKLCTMKRGSVIGVRGPFGTSWPVESAKGNDVIIVTGGIGLSPLRPAIYHILSQRKHYGKFILLYGARTPADIVHLKDLQEWSKNPNIDLHITVDRGDRAWTGNVGVVTTLIPKANFDPTNITAMVCGPEIMMRFTIMDLQKRGVKDDDIYISMERNMKCGIGLCGHCQLGPAFVCKDGPVFRYDKIREFFLKRGI